MPVKHLYFLAGVHVPYTTGFIAGRSDDFVPLRIKLYLGYLVFVALEQSSASSCENVVHTSKAVCRGGSQFVTRAIETSVKHFIVVTAESLDALPGSHVPQFATPIDRPSEAVLSSEVKLSARQLTRMSFKRVDALACHDVPDLCCIVE